MPQSKSNNPFSPQFGKRPRSFIGREALISQLLDAFCDENSPARPITSLSGVRQSLMDRGLVRAPSYGYVQLTLPFLSEFLLEQEKQGNIGIN